MGERVVVTRLEEKTATDGETTYRNFRVLFPDRPQLSTDDLFDLGDQPHASRREQRPAFQEEEPPPKGSGQDGDIPF